MLYRFYVLLCNIDILTSCIDKRNIIEKKQQRKQHNDNDNITHTRLRVAEPVVVRQLHVQSDRDTDTQTQNRYTHHMASNDAIGHFISTFYS